MIYGAIVQLPRTRLGPKAAIQQSHRRVMISAILSGRARSLREFPRVGVRWQGDREKWRGVSLQKWARKVAEQLFIYCLYPSRHASTRKRSIEDGGRWRFWSVWLLSGRSMFKSNNFQKIMICKDQKDYKYRTFSSKRGDLFFLLFVLFLIFFWWGDLLKSPPSIPHLKSSTRIRKYKQYSNCKCMYRG